MERLQKLIAAAGICSRRAAEALIGAGRVQVNGRVVDELGAKAAPDDQILVDGQEIGRPRRLRYVLLHKPTGYVTTRHDPAGRPTIYDLLFDDDRVLHPVGRLDRDSQGLLLLTNDGELTLRLTHPRYGLEKAYRVGLKPWPTRPFLKRLRQGVELEDGFAKPKLVKQANPESVELVLTEGRNREVRRIMEALGVEVTYLRRIRQGPLTLGALKIGKARPLRDDEVDRLREAVGLPPATARG
ncbi:MAG: rRNA pseudouridine synthase [Fimbriimonadaceae bacterium]|nr:rRNA pseudouridine synthase [Fimbriimonadaceae bacterium]